MGRLCNRKLCGEQDNSRRPLHSAIIRRVPTRYRRHRSLYACRVTNPLETNRSCSRHPDPAPIGRAWPYLDVEAHGARPPDTLQIDVEQSTSARRALHELGFLELLGHGASRSAQTSHADAKNASVSKLPVTGDDICHCQHLRGGARWLEAHRVRKLWQRHGKTLLTARTHVWDVTGMDACNRRTHF